MPNPDGQLTDKELEYIDGWLNDRIGEIVCPLCKHTSWSANVFLIQSTLFRTRPTQAMWFFPLFCSHCAHTLLFNAHVMDLLPEAGDPARSHRDG